MKFENSLKTSSCLKTAFFRDGIYKLPERLFFKDIESSSEYFDEEIRFTLLLILNLAEKFGLIICILNNRRQLPPSGAGIGESRCRRRAWRGRKGGRR